MPTYGWIREDAWEAFLEGTAFRGAGLLEPHAAQRSYECPFCAQSFSNVQHLQFHFLENHRITRPLLLIDGKEPETENTIRIRRPASDFQITNATKIRVRIDSGQIREITAKGLASELARLRQATVWVELINASEVRAAPVTSSYRLSVRIADEEVYQQVERAFVEIVLESPLSMRTVTEFLADPRCTGAGTDYAEGISSYLTGILVKRTSERTAHNLTAKSLPRFVRSGA